MTYKSHIRSPVKEHLTALHSFVEATHSGYQIMVIFGFFNILPLIIFRYLVKLCLLESRMMYCQLWKTNERFKTI